jgi:secreted trypsin-like serine protease
VDGAAVNILRIIAGLHDRSNEAGAQIADVAAYKMHEQYNVGAPSYANDIAILTLAQNIGLGGNVAAAILPGDDNDFAGQNCVITGWGRTSADNNLPNILQKATIGILTTGQCQNQVAGIANIWDGHICIYDAETTRGACNGDSGGPINCFNGANTLVTGVASFVIQSGGSCLPTYPSTYTRVSYYRGWIQANTP